MPTYQERLLRQIPGNQELFNAWIESFGPRKKSTIDQYKSAVTSYLDSEVDDSIERINFDSIKKYFDGYIIKGLSPATITTQIAYLKNFLEFVYKNRPEIFWDFEIKDLDSLKPDKDEVNQTKGREKPLSFEEFYQIGEFFNTHLNIKKWVVTYTIFRLIFSYGFDKYEIASINNESYNPDTGKYITNDKGDSITFDAELVKIFRKYGTGFLGYKDSTIYSKLKEIGELLHRNITQEDIKATRNLFMFICPNCGKKIENKGSLLGYVEINMMNIDGVIMCKECLGKMKDENNI